MVSSKKQVYTKAAYLAFVADVFHEGVIRILPLVIDVLHKSIVGSFNTLAVVVGEADAEGIDL